MHGPTMHACMHRRMLYTEPSWRYAGVQARSYEMAIVIAALRHHPLAIPSEKVACLQK